MSEINMKHEIVINNSDIDVRFYLSKDNGSYVAPHWHNSFEIVYIIDGKLTLNLPNGVSQITKSGEFFIVNSRTIHSVISDKNTSLVLQVPLKLFEKFVPSFETLYFQADIKSLKNNDINKIFLDMYNIYSSQPEGYLLRFNSLLYDLLFILIQSYSKRLMPQEVVKSNKYFKLIRNIANYIDKNHNRAITINEISQKFHYNNDYISRIFKKYMNITIIEYIYEIRLNYIYNDLKNTSLSIREIFENHGCSNYNLTMKLFKNRWNCTPKQKRKEFDIKSK